MRSSPPVTDALADARERTLALVAALSDADVETQHVEIMSPLVWDLAHIAAYEELWLVHRHGGEPLSRPELSAMYDAFETPRAVRGDLPLLDRAEALEYLEDVRERVPDGSRFCTSWSCATRTSTGRRCCRRSSSRASPPRRPCRAPSARRRPAATPASSPCSCPAGPCSIGAPDDRFAYDNERPRHRAELPAFRIGRTPITNATFLHFVEGGGYERRPWWSDEAWAWKEEYDITHPEGWARGPTGEWRRWTLDGWAPIDPDEPVVHVSWFEADALADAHGARLPTEAEWEKAATWDQETGEARRIPWGDEPPDARHANLDQGLLGPAPAGAYPDGASPVRRARHARRRLGVDGERLPRLRRLRRRTRTASTPRSSSATTTRCCAAARGRRGRAWRRPTFRNWDLPQRRQIFSGVRLAWDA